MNELNEKIPFKQESWELKEENGIMRIKKEEKLNYKLKVTKTKEKLGKNADFGRDCADKLPIIKNNCADQSESDYRMLGRNQSGTEDKNSIAGTLMELRHGLEPAIRKSDVMMMNDEFNE